MGGRERPESGGDAPSSRSDDAPASSERERARRLRETVRRRYGDDADALADRLDAADPEERAGAAWALAELATEDPDRLPARTELAALLEDDHRWVRRGASWALAVAAESNPHYARPVVAEIAESLDDDDPLVRENGVLALAGVGAEYPLAVEPALSRLAELTDDEDDLARRYAADALRNLVVRLDEDGFPRTIAAGPDLADVLPGDAGVVEVSDDPDDRGTVRVRRPNIGDAGPSGGGDETADEEDEDDERGPPELIPEPPAVSADFGSFERLADLGRGRFTAAAKARTPADGGRHVVVTLRTARTDADVDPAALARAFRTWASVADHDHAVPVVARGETPRPWAATEFMDGGSLRDAVGRIGLERALWYAHCLTRVVCYAHARGVVHGALRPGAVGLSRTLGAWPVPKVGDWGFGEVAADGPPGPPAFAAPEHLAPAAFGRPDHSTDVYQLGAVCYALFAGRPPFVGDASEVVRRVREREPAPASALAGEVPDGLDDLLARALAKEKQARYETVEDFRRALEVVLDERAPVWW
ncbi:MULTISPECIES: protein kinase domain-containing protein [Halorussus]|uniref:protein kinase domain-containing protein n=1 Tax=Halorussus TaxID=1070314 RepID=UPI00209D38D0|nr:HEAT repeat domain-containing protein [Halorussus vallis]USZ78191.1 HEAT repeat domain-containing protein [Halorussus vallis]